MAEFKTIAPRPGIIGLAVCGLMLASRILVAAGGKTMESLNTVLVLIALCLCLHLVRRTSLLFQPHVWHSRVVLLLFLLPLLTLTAAGLQLLLLEAHSFLSSKPFVAVLIFVSVPVFLCLYFLYVSAKLPAARGLRVFSRILLSFGILYTVLRLLDTVLLPFIAKRTTAEIPQVLLTVAGWNTQLSLLIYLMAFGGFILLHGELKTVRTQTE